MTAPALPGAAPDPARLPPEVEATMAEAFRRAIEAGYDAAPDDKYFGAGNTEVAMDVLLASKPVAALRTAIRAALDKRGEVSAASAASARALGGDGEPVAWQRGCKPVGNRAVVEACHTSDLEPDDVIFHEGAWFVVLDDDLNDSTQVLAAPILDDAGGRGEPDFCYGEFFVRCVPTRPAATGDTGEVEKARAAFLKSAKDASERFIKWNNPDDDGEWDDAAHDAMTAAFARQHADYRALMAAERSATGDHPSEARRGHESEGRGGPDAR